MWPDKRASHAGIHSSTLLHSFSSFRHTERHRSFLLSERSLSGHMSHRISVNTMTHMLLTSNRKKAATYSESRCDPNAGTGSWIKIFHIIWENSVHSCSAAAIVLMCAHARKQKRGAARTLQKWIQMPGSLSRHLYLHICSWCVPPHFQYTSYMFLANNGFTTWKIISPNQ